MSVLQQHRGPDDEGIHASPGVVLGHRRLSILDLTERGHQPMSRPGTPHWIVHNGEVYNYLELRRELEGEGFRFESETDTEVILAAYERWGEECVARMNGMFAFAIWNDRDRTLFCARDRFGIKPFHYVVLPDGTLAFASEIKAFHGVPDLPIEIDESTVVQYLGFARVNAGPETFVRGVRSLAPAHCFTLRLGEAPRPRRYWDLIAEREPGTFASDAEAMAEFRSRLVDSIRLRLRSDVPVGTCLSGGLDSSTVVVVVDDLLRRQTDPPLQATFSACFPDASIDERPFMQAVTRQTNTKPHEVYPDAEGLREDLGRLIWHQDEPFVSTSVYAQFCVFRLARSAGVVVTLDGQGADELLGGYDHYAPTFLHALKLSAGRWAAIGEARSYARTRGIPLRRVLRRSRKTRRNLQEERAPGRFLHPDLRAGGSAPGPLAGAEDSPLGLFHEHLRRDLTVDMLPSLLRHADRNSMAFGVESRVPFLDHRIAELCFALPPHMLVRDGWTKRPIRDAFGDLLPAEVTWRRDKLGFAPPEARWFREGAGELFEDLLRERKGRVFERFVDYEATREAWSRFERKGRFRGEFWRILNLHLWLEHYLTGDYRPTAC
jgi:asparagine synthase (glutamine-hydrolysing)